MWNRKHGKLILLVMLVSVLLMGCVNIDIKVSVNLDGSGIYEISFLTDNPMIKEELAKKSGGSAPDFAELEKKGYKYEEVKDQDGKSGFRLIKKVDNIMDQPIMEDLDEITTVQIQYFGQKVASLNSNIPLASKNTDGKIEFTQDKGIFFDNYTIRTEVDLTDTGEIDEALSFIKLRMLLSLPIEPKTHNATKVLDDGTLAWDVKYGEKNPVFIEMSVPNLITWGIIIGLVLIGIIIAVILLVKRKKGTTNWQASTIQSEVAATDSQTNIHTTPVQTPQQESKKQDDFKWD